MENTLLEIKNLSKSFGENTVLKDINLEIKEGEVIGLVGENGAGKSTLMKIIFGMPVIKETGGYNGEVKVNGAVETQRGKKLTGGEIISYNGEEIKIER